VVVKREDVEFALEGDVTLRGWLFVPEGPGPHPGITMAHGFAGVRERGLERFARVFANAGFVVLVHDHRGFGASDGEPRFDVDGLECRMSSTSCLSSASRASRYSWDSFGKIIDLLFLSIG
jgi:dienelactone hydrolase